MLVPSLTLPGGHVVAKRAGKKHTQFIPKNPQPAVSKRALGRDANPVTFL